MEGVGEARPGVHIHSFPTEPKAKFWAITLSLLSGHKLLYRGNKNHTRSILQNNAYIDRKCTSRIMRTAEPPKSTMNPKMVKNRATAVHL